MPITGTIAMARTPTDTTATRTARFVPIVIEGVTEDDYLVLSDKEGGLWFAGGQRLRRFKNGVTQTYDFSGFGAGSVNHVAYEDRHGKTVSFNM